MEPASPINWQELVASKQRLEEARRTNTKVPPASYVFELVFDSDTLERGMSLLRQFDPAADILARPDAVRPAPLELAQFDPNRHLEQPVLRFSYSETQRDNAGPREPDMREWAVSGVGAVIDFGNRPWVVVYVEGQAQLAHTVHIAPIEAVQLSQ